MSFVTYDKRLRCAAEALGLSATMLARRSSVTFCNGSMIFCNSPAG
jgi:hypothetical protein